jgi:hypothetical protein
MPISAHDCTAAICIEVHTFREETLLSEHHVGDCSMYAPSLFEGSDYT